MCSWYEITGAAFGTDYCIKMHPEDDKTARLFWRRIVYVTGERVVSWNTFSANFEVTVYLLGTETGS